MLVVANGFTRATPVVAERSQATLVRAKRLRTFERPKRTKKHLKRRMTNLASRTTLWMQISMIKTRMMTLSS